MNKISILLAVLVAVPACHGSHDPEAPVEHRTDAVMEEAGVAVPIAPGKTAAWQSALEELVGPRYAEYEASRTRFGLTSQTTFLQQTPMGDFAVIHLTGPDVHKSFHAMSSSQDAWDVKWRELTMDLHGVDFAQGERVMPKIAPAYSMDSGGPPGGRSFMFVAPLGSGGADRIRAIAREVMGDRHADYVRARARIGVRREAAFLESTAKGDAVVFYWVADDPVASLAKLADSTDPFDVWLRGEAERAHPISLAEITRIASANKLIAQYPRAQ
jgi:hypothetical protein